MKNNFDFWKSIWDAKGNSESNNLLFLDGYDHMNYEFSSKQICDDIIKTLNIKKTDRILEVGCGAGFLGGYLKDKCKYFGIDYSVSLLEKHFKYFHNDICVGQANNLPFSNDRFDKTFCFGVFQYFPSKEYAKKSIEEMKRVSREKIFIGDLKKIKTNDYHLAYSYEEFSGFSFLPCIYDKESKNRFNAFLELR